MKGLLNYYRKPKDYMVPFLKKIFLLFSLLSVSLTASALIDTNSEDPIHIIANATLFNYKTGINTYEGEVRIDQGVTHLTADRVITQSNDKHKVILATAYGLTRQAEYSTLPKNSTVIMTALADEIEFTPETEIVVLKG